MWVSMKDNRPASQRRVGVELEFLGPSARAAADALATHLGGSSIALDPHSYVITNTRFGDMVIETDLRHVHPDRHPELEWRLNSRVAAWLGTVVSPFVPKELITGPLPMAELSELRTVLEGLRVAGAYGRGAVLWDSLGLHFNIDPPRLDAETVVTFLKAFLLVSDRLRVEIARGSRRRQRALPPDYPQAYKRRVLDPDYRPNLETLTADYLAANPTRRRGLDLLPLLAHFDESRVRAVLPREKISARPVFHYRMPQSHLSDPTWTIMPDWERWLRVEHLASDSNELMRLGRANAGSSDLSG
jgi:hypothetical protein